MPFFTSAQNPLDGLRVNVTLDVDPIGVPDTFVTPIGSDRPSAVRGQFLYHPRTLPRAVLLPFEGPQRDKRAGQVEQRSDYINPLGDMFHPLLTPVFERRPGFTPAGSRRLRLRDY
jgi:hypothetical protein